MALKTCSWCGKQYDPDKFDGIEYFETQKLLRHYCSKKCAVAGENQHDKEVIASGGTPKKRLTSEKIFLYFLIFIIVVSVLGVIEKCVS